MVSSLEESGNRFVETYEKLRKGEKVEKREILSFESPEVMRKMLTKERLRILKVVRAEKPKTIYALAKIVHRPYSNVFKDVKELAEMGLLELGREKGKVEPKAKYDRLKITIPV